MNQKYHWFAPTVSVVYQCKLIRERKGVTIMTTMSERDIRDMIQAGKNAPYNSIKKAVFQCMSLRLLRQVRDMLRLTPDNCRVSYNAGGIAVSGESVLHSDHVYIQVSGFSDTGVMVRAVSGQKDYTGAGNRYYTFTDLIANGPAGLATFAEYVASVDHGCSPCYGKAPRSLLLESLSGSLSNSDADYRDRD